MTSHFETSQDMTSNFEKSQVLTSHFETSQDMTSHFEKSQALTSHFEMSQDMTSHFEKSEDINSGIYHALLPVPGWQNSSACSGSSGDLPSYKLII